MIRRLKSSLYLCLMIMLVITGSLATAAWGQSQANAHATASQQPLYSDYKGVRIGMAAAEVREKLGKPTMAGDEQDYYIVSPSETVQIAYDKAQKTKAISIDFIEGIGAPDYKAVVGPDVETKPDGSIHKMVTYESLGFWVSYHRSAGTVPTVSITIQRMLKG
jgi:outer membrane protein assembly factor BamE (lipoprotein component of BamABCDE complex)